MHVISAENISKKYIIDHQGTKKSSSLRDAFSNTFEQFFSSKNGQAHSKEKEEFWALKDVSFNISQGDRIGIVGHNGAGKSTLLKILSRITDPTTGQVSIDGRVASLLEVGTGFHPELTGRENIFLNGAILGMDKGEIRKSFDAIVDFAGVEKFLDTPVKRYSSGMYVRLGFAIAAHLEPEIMIIDEVLAVGDFRFRQKSLARVREMRAKSAFVFVSHSMGDVAKFCDRVFVLHKGRVYFEGPPAEAIEVYEALDQGVPSKDVPPQLEIDEK